jgi:hypothetical protein
MTLIMIIFMISVLYKVKAFGAAHVKVSKVQVAEHRPDRAVRRRRLRCDGRRPERGDFEIIFAAANAQAARPVARFPSPDPGSAFFFGNGATVGRSLFQAHRAGVFDFTVDQHHAFLAGIGIDAGEAKGERRILTDHLQTVEHGLAKLEFDLEGVHASPGRDRAEWR